MKKFERTLVMLLLCSIFCSLLAGCGSSTLELQDTKLHVKPGKTAQVSVETDSRPLTFESSDPDIATVDDNGVVEGVAEGPAIITVTNSKGKSETLQVIVDRVEPESITFDPAAFTLSPNEIVATDLIIHPDNTTYYKVSYSSSNNDVAMVDRKGLIKAVAAGKAVITATAENGISAQCAVTVRQNAESLDIEPTLKMQINDKETLKVTPVPANSVKENYTWNTSNPAVAIVDENGTVTAVSPGAAAITVEGETSGCYAVCVATVIPEPFTIRKITNRIDSYVDGLAYELNYYATVDVSGGTAPYSYRFELIQNNEVTATSDWQTIRSSEGYAAGEGTCLLRVTVMDAEGYFTTDVLDLLNT